MATMDVFVVSACSGEKQFEDPPIGCAEIDSVNRKELVGEYLGYATPTAQTYTGPEYSHAREAVADFRDHANVSWCSTE